VDPQDETIYDAVIRETLEETGLHLERRNIKPIYLWESAFPTNIQQGIPNRHHLIVYFHATVDLFNQNSPKEDRYEKILKLQLEEVESATWINLDNVSGIYKSLKSDTTQPKQNETCQAFDINGNYSTLATSVFYNNDSTIGNERLTTGSRFLLGQWYDLKQKHKI